jgi:tetratricopeptide (TPR) repeat protein
MILSILAFVLAILALGVAGSILWRHWNKIRLFDPESLKEEQHRQKRAEFIRRRFERMRADRIQPVKRIGRQMARAASRSYQSVYERLQAFEAMYKNVKNPLGAMAPSTRERIKTLLSEGRSLVRDLKFADAERRFLEVLALDAHQPDAYKGIGQIYLKQKLYPQAKETYEFLVKMKKADDGTFSGLAEIAEIEGNIPQAEAMRLKAVQASPRQAFRHAELAQFYVEREQYDRAKDAITRAIDIEQSSPKYTELALDIAFARKDIKEARLTFDRLRLLSDDQSRFQTWREKLETLERTPSPGTSPLTKK